MAPLCTAINVTMASSNELLDEGTYVTEQTLTSAVTSPRYDDYLRQVGDIGEFSYVVLGCIGLVFCILGVLANVMCIPVFFTHNIRAPATTYMFVIAVFDTLTLLCGASVLVTSAMWPKQIDQVQVYKSVTGYLVPYVQPMMEFTEMMSVYLCAALLIERYKYIKHGIYVRVLCSMGLTNRIIGVLFVFCFVYNVPKVLEFQVETVQVSVIRGSNAQGNSSSAAGKGYSQVRVLRTELGNSTTFQEVYENLLRVPLEMFLPLIVVGLFGALVANSVFSSGMHATALSAPPGEISKGEYDVEECDREKRVDKQPESATPSAASASTLEIAEWREQMNTVVAAGVAMLVLTYKLCEFIQHMLLSERARFGISMVNLLRFGAVVNLLALANAALKPIAYFTCGAHFREAAKTLFCICCSRISKPFGNQSDGGSANAAHGLGEEEHVPMIEMASDTPLSAQTPTQPTTSSQYTSHPTV